MIPKRAIEVFDRGTRSEVNKLNVFSLQPIKIPCKQLPSSFGAHPIFNHEAEEGLPEGLKAQNISEHRSNFLSVLPRFLDLRLEIGDVFPKP